MSRYSKSNIYFCKPASLEKRNCTAWQHVFDHAKELHTDKVKIYDIDKKNVYKAIYIFTLRIILHVSFTHYMYIYLHLIGYENNYI